MTSSKIKKTQLDKLYQQSQEKELQISDGDNLYVIVTKVGSCIFKYRVVIGGKKSWLTLGNYPVMTLSEARERAIEVKRQVVNGIDPFIAKQDAKNKKMTLSEFAELYIKERVPVVRKVSKNTDKHVGMIRNQILSVLGKYYLDSITDDKIRNLIDKKTAQGTHAIANQILVTLNSILSYAEERKLIDKNPIVNKKYYNIDTHSYRERYLTEDEITKLMRLIYGESVTHIKYAIAIHLLLMLLLRKTELVHAKWEQVDFNKGIFMITSDCKTGKSLQIGLPTQAVKLFRILKTLSGNSEFIFHGSTEAVAINENCINKSIGVVRLVMFGSNKSKYFSVHDLRRTGRSHLGNTLHYPSDYIEEALNHVKPNMIRRYQVGDYFVKRKEMLQDWANVIDGLIGEELLPYDRLLS